MLLDRINAWLLAILLVIAPTMAEASQGNLYSPTTGTVSGLQLTNNFNNGLDALNTGNSGSTAPTNQLSATPSLGNRWLNTTANPYPDQIWDGVDWLAPFYIDATNHLILNQVGGGAVSMAAASSTNLCSVPQYFLTVTGNTTITGFGTGCFIGQTKKVTFSGTPTLTYNLSSLILPGSANILVSAGDAADVVYLGSGNWQVTNYTPANGQALINPAIDVGDYVMTAALSPPSAKYLFAYGQAVSRATYATLLAAVTNIQSVTATNGSPTLTGFSDTTQLAPGMAVEASFLPNGTVIAPAGCTSTTCTLNNNASASTTGNATIFPYGNGCGFGSSCSSPSTNFNLPDCRDIVMAGRGNMGGAARSDSYQLTATYFGASPNALGSFGGGQSYTLRQSDLPNVTPTIDASTAVWNTVALGGGAANLSAGGVGYVTGGFNGGSSGGGVTNYTSKAGLFSGAINSSSINGNVSQTTFSKVPPTLTANCMLRVLAMVDLPIRHLALNDNDRRSDIFAIERRRRSGSVRTIG